MTPRGVGAARPSLARSVSQEEERARRAKLAQERRAKVMAQMSALQKVFIKENAQLLASMEAEEYDSILLTFSPHSQCTFVCCLRFAETVVQILPYLQICIKTFTDLR